MRRIELHIEKYLFVDYFGRGVEYTDADEQFMPDSEEAFHKAKLGRARWVIWRRFCFDHKWQAPPSLVAAMQAASGKGCVKLTGEREFARDSRRWNPENDIDFDSDVDGVSNESSIDESDYDI